MKMLRFQSLYFQLKKGRYSSFLKKVFVFKKIGFKVKVFKTSKISSDCQSYFENHQYRFIEDSMLFLLGSK